ncbi:MAG: FeoA family protein [Pseudomonadota bacterium]
MSAEFSLPLDAALRHFGGAVGLTALTTMADARIVAVVAPDVAGGAELPERLAELGFLVGERVRVLARAPFGDPLAVRVGSGTFALRRLEADCIRVMPLASSPR